MAEMIKEVTVKIQTSTQELAEKIINRTAETLPDSRVYLGLAGREFRCSHDEGRKFSAGETATFVFGGDADVTYALANDPATRSMDDARSYPVYIRFAPMPAAIEHEDHWCVEHVTVTVEGTEGGRVSLTGLDGQTRLFLGLMGGYTLYLQPGAAHIKQGPTIVRGSVKANGRRAAGSGFTVAKTGTGDFTVTFDTAFPEPPIVVATIFGPKWLMRANAHVTETTTTHAVIRTGTDDGDPAHRDFHFIATAVSDG